MQGIPHLRLSMQGILIEAVREGKETRQLDGKEFGYGAKIAEANFFNQSIFLQYVPLARAPARWSEFLRRSRAPFRSWEMSRGYAVLPSKPDWVRCPISAALERVIFKQMSLLGRRAADVGSARVFTAFSGQSI